VQRLLALLATGERVGEAGTAFAEGSAAMAETARSVVTDDFELLFHDAGDFQTEPVGAWRARPRPARAGRASRPRRPDARPLWRGRDRDWAFRHPLITATEVLTTPRTSTLLFARLQCSGPSDPSGGDPVSVQ